MVDLVIALGDNQDTYNCTYGLKCLMKFNMLFMAYHPSLFWTLIPIVSQNKIKEKKTKKMMIRFMIQGTTNTLQLNNELHRFFKTTKN